MEDDLSVWNTVEQSDNKGVIFVDEKYIGFSFHLLSPQKYIDYSVED
jgi:hypothetical protein